MGNIGERIKQARRQEGLTLVELAGQIGMRPEYLVGLELGYERAPEEMVVHILGVIKNWRILRVQTLEKRLGLARKG